MQKTARDVRHLGRFKGLLSAMTLLVTMGYGVLSIATWGSGLSAVSGFIAIGALAVSVWLIVTGTRQEQFRW